MRPEVVKFTNDKTGQSADYTVNHVESIEDLLAAFEGNLNDYQKHEKDKDGNELESFVKNSKGETKVFSGLLSWATANLPANRNEYQKARLGTEPPVKTLASSVLALVKTGLPQFTTIEAAAAVVCIGPAEAYREDVIKEAKRRQA